MTIIVTQLATRLDSGSMSIHIIFRASTYYPCVFPCVCQALAFYVDRNEADNFLRELKARFILEQRNDNSDEARNEFFRLPEFLLGWTFIQWHLVLAQIGQPLS